jgi:hypothetical protein
MARTIPLSQGKIAVVDDLDFAELSKHKWYAMLLARYKPPAFVAARHARKPNGECTIITMHRQIMKTPPGFEVDHRNHDTLDNRRGNLRNCTHYENSRNRRLSSLNTTGLKGICKLRNGRWQAQIVLQNKQRHLGIFATAEAAHNAYAEAALGLYGEFANPSGA